MKASSSLLPKACVTPIKEFHWDHLNAMGLDFDINSISITGEKSWTFKVEVKIDLYGIVDVVKLDAWIN